VELLLFGRVPDKDFDLLTRQENTLAMMFASSWCEREAKLSKRLLNQCVAVVDYGYCLVQNPHCNIECQEKCVVIAL
jgi:hypothetical protein